MGATICNEKNWEVTTSLTRLARINPISMGNRHQPVKHSLALEMFKDKISDKRLKITGENGMLSKDLHKYIYTCEVEDSSIPDLAFTLGFVNFNNKTKAFTGLFGEKVFVCSNEMFKGETIHNKRHTTNIMEVLGGKIDGIVGNFDKFREKRMQEINKMKSIKIGDSDIGEFVLNMHRKKIMSNTNISRFIRECDKPRHPDFEDKNLWSLQNNFTEITKLIDNPLYRVEATNAMSSLIERKLQVA